MSLLVKEYTSLSTRYIMFINFNDLSARRIYRGIRFWILMQTLRGIVYNGRSSWLNTVQNCSLENLSKYLADNERLALNPI